MDNHSSVPSTPQFYFQSHFPSFAIFFPLYISTLPKKKWKQACLSRHLSIINRMDKAAFLFNLITRHFAERYWNEMVKIDGGMLENEEGPFTLTELLFPLELSASPPSAFRWSELFSHRGTIRGSKKMISLCTSHLQTG